LKRLGQLRVGSAVKEGRKNYIHVKTAPGFWQLSYKEFSRKVKEFVLKERSHSSRGTEHPNWF
jgi:hypothetical protein